MRLPEVLDALSAPVRRHPRICPFTRRNQRAAIRILVTARRGSRAPLAIMPGLVLHQADGAWTPRADAILRGKAELASLTAH